MNNSTILPLVNKPGRYIGKEYNSKLPSNPRPKLTCGLVFPDLYEIGMSHQGLQILYHILNETGHILAERCYCPDIDVETLLRHNHVPLVTLESGTPLSDFDLIGITLPHELCYTNILTVLSCADIPFFAAERNEEHPIILGGGACAFNPEPVADFFDGVLLGDGEEAIIEICLSLVSSAEKGLPREERILELGDIAGVYLPHRFKPTYAKSGRLSAMTPLSTTAPTIDKRVISSLDALDHLYHPIVPNAKIVHDRLGIEVARGCTRGCRFCQAGITYRPVRERSVSQVMTLAENAIINSGFEEISLLSLSTGDYSCLPELLPQLMNRYGDEHVSIALPSMRVGTLTEELMDEIKRVRKTGFTLAPEAGSERLRQVINKGISEADLLDTARHAFRLGWNLIKLYFMIGLPTETIEDIEAIVELAKKTAAAGDVKGGGRKRVNVSVGTFVPKPHTPFQWEEQLNINQSRERIDHLKKSLPKKGFNLKWHDPEQSYLEGVFSRGDRRLSALIVSAWKSGARLDSWSDHFDLQRWLDGAQLLGIDLDFYLRRRDQGELLPWSHLSSGVDDSFLREEWVKALAGAYTPDCRYHECQQCGLCDFDSIAPLVHSPQERILPDSGSRPSPPQPAEQRPLQSYTYLVTYSRKGLICYLGHLEFLQVIFRALRRANIKTCFSQGYNPSPKISFSPALPVGTESLCENFTMELVSPLTDIARTVKQLNEVLPEGIVIQDIGSDNTSIPRDLIIAYTIKLDTMLTSAEREMIEKFCQASTWMVSRIRKGKKKQIDIRQLVVSIMVESDSLLKMKLISKSGSPGVKPLIALSHILKRKSSELLTSSVCKTSWEPL